MNGPDASTTMAYARMMAHQRIERERAQRRLASQHTITIDGDTDEAPARHALTGKLRVLRTSFGHSMAILLRFTRLRAGTTPA